MTDDRQLLDELAEALQPEPSEPSARHIALVRQAVTKQRTAQTAPMVVTRASRRLIVGLAVAAMLVGIVGAVLVGPALEDFRKGGSVEYSGAAQRPQGGDAGQVEVTRLDIGRVVTLQTDSLPILPKGAYYEVWFVAEEDRADDPDRISAGTFHPDESGRSAVSMTAAVDPTLYPVLEVTSEPGDGDPAVNGPVVLTTRLDEGG